MSLATATRNAAYYSIPDLGERQRQVLEVIQAEGPIYNRAIARLMDLEINQITGRVAELREMGLVEEAGTGLDPETSRSVTLWRVASGDMHAGTLPEPTPEELEELAALKAARDAAWGKRRPAGGDWPTFAFANAAWEKCYKTLYGKRPPNAQVDRESDEYWQPLRYPRSERSVKTDAERNKANERRHAK